MTMTTIDHPRQRTELVYRFEAQLAPMFPIGVFPEGIRFHNEFEGTVTDGPFAGARIFGLDPFVLRRDGVGVVEAPEVIDLDGRRLSVQVKGYVLPPEGTPAPDLDAVAAGTAEIPDAPLRFIGSAFLATTDTGFARYNRVVAVLEGQVNLATGRITVEAWET
jgi:hypothetical protein